MWVLKRKRKKNKVSEKTEMKGEKPSEEVEKQHRSRTLCLQLLLDHKEKQWGSFINIKHL